MDCGQFISPPPIATLKAKEKSIRQFRKNIAITHFLIMTLKPCQKNQWERERTST